MLIEPEQHMANTELISTGWTTSGPSALDKFEDIAKKSEWVIGAMAFFTHGNGSPLNKRPGLMRCLNSNSSYLCVGWNSPTNFDKIKTLYNKGKGVKFYVNVAKVAKLSNKIERINDNLLHSKLLVFKDKVGDGYTVTIGSHNWTNKAIKGTTTKSGLNLEDSIIIQCKEKNDLVKSCLERIEHIKDQCLTYSRRIHRNLLILQASDDQARILYFDETTLKSSPSEVYISFESRKAAEKFKQGTAGFLIDPSTDLAVKFESQGSWSSTNVKADGINRYLAPWTPRASMVFTMYSAGSPSPSNHLALLSLNFMGRKHKATLHKPAKKTDLWHQIGGEDYAMQIDDEQKESFTIRHWKEINREPQPSPEQLLPADEPLKMKTIEQLKAYRVTFNPPLTEDE